MVLSSVRYKRNIHDMGGASAGLVGLRPVTFRSSISHSAPWNHPPASDSSAYRNRVSTRSGRQARKPPAAVVSAGQRDIHTAVDQRKFFF